MFGGEIVGGVRPLDGMNSLLVGVNLAVGMGEEALGVAVEEGTNSLLEDENWKKWITKIEQ